MRVACLKMPNAEQVEVYSAEKQGFLKEHRAAGAGGV